MKKGSDIESYIVDLLNEKIVMQCYSLVEYIVEDGDCSEGIAYYHLRQLRKAEKVKREKHGRETFYYLTKNEGKAMEILRKKMLREVVLKRKWKRIKKQSIEYIHNLKREHPDKFDDFLKEIVEKGYESYPGDIHMYYTLGYTSKIEILTKMSKYSQLLCVLVEFPDYEIMKRVKEHLGLVRYDDCKGLFESLQGKG